MKKIYVVIVFCFAFLLLTNFSAQAQRYKKQQDTEQDSNDDETVQETQDSSKLKNFLRKLTYGGGLGASFGQVTFVDVSPMVGYRATDKLTVGVGGTYNYLGIKDYDPTTGQTYKYNFNLYGGRLFTQYVFYKNFFAHAEFEALNVPDWSNYANRDQRAWITAPLVGGGYRSQIGSRSYINITALYHLKYAQNQAIFPMYGSPLILRISFSL